MMTLASALLVPVRLDEIGQLLEVAEIVAKTETNAWFRLGKFLRKKKRALVEKGWTIVSADLICDSRQLQPAEH